MWAACGCPSRCGGHGPLRYRCQSFAARGGGQGPQTLPLHVEDSLTCNTLQRHLYRGHDPEPQLIVEAIAALYETNRTLRAVGSPTLQAKTSAGFTIVGTKPIFYKILVTKGLLTCPATSQYPHQVTTVERLIPPVPFPEMLEHDGMRPLVNRRIILQCFEAFRQFVVSHSACLGVSLSPDEKVARIETKTRVSDIKLHNTYVLRPCPTKERKKRVNEVSYAGLAFLLRALVHGVSSAPSQYAYALSSRGVCSVRGPPCVQQAHTAESR